MKKNWSVPAIEKLVIGETANGTYPDSQWDLYVRENRILPGGYFAEPGMGPADLCKVPGYDGEGCS